MHSLFAADVWLANGWQCDVRVDVDDGGTISAVIVDGDPAGCERIEGAVIPGLCDLHSHAFQRAMAGLAEGSGGTHPTDTFWTWRELMYRFVARLSPEMIEDIAAQLYVELLKGGYTSVCEFHYVHHAPDGRPYANPAEMSERIVAAARRAKIGMTLLPVLYMTSTFDTPAHEGQKRFLGAPETLLRIVGQLRQARYEDVCVGIAPHSLRAVPVAALDDIVHGFGSLGGGPIHMHIAEQEREVEECLAWSGQRPVEWLLQHQRVDARWCLVHATHMTSAETSALARSHAVAGLCPTTEGNLGDGFFMFPDYLESQGAYGIGSDSNVTSIATEELRALEYSQRLQQRRRNIGSNNTGPAGEALYRAALHGGAQASGRAIAGIEPGMRADFVVLDTAHPALVGRPSEAFLDAYVFCGHGNPVRDVMVGGQWVVRDGHHALETDIAMRYANALQGLA